MSTMFSPFPIEILGIVSSVSPQPTYGTITYFQFKVMPLR